MDTILTPPVSASDHLRGSPAAPMTLVQYGDYECPYCAEAFPLVQELMDRLDGSLRFVFRHYPVGRFHPHARDAAEAAEAAGAQERFWDMHDLLHGHADALERADLMRYAEQLGLDTERFHQDLLEHTYGDRVQEDFRSGVKSGVNATPTFFVNGARYDDDLDLDAMLEALEFSNPQRSSVAYSYMQRLNSIMGRAGSI